MTDEDKKKVRAAVLDILRNAAPIKSFDIRMKLRDRGIDWSASKLDRIVQSLRREGLIKFEKQKWLLSSTKTCEACGGTGRIHDDRPIAA